MKTQVKEYEKAMFDELVRKGNFTICQGQVDFILEGLVKSHTVLKGQMLDVGCGVTGFGFKLAETFKDLKVTGIDISLETVRQEQDRNVLFADAEERNNFKQGTFDAVLSMCFLHHFPDITPVMQNIDYWLKPGGILIIMEPNARNLIKQASRICRKIFEFFGGTDYMLKQGMATPNETLHAIGEYLKHTPNYKLLYNCGFPEKQRFRKEDVLLILRKNE